MFHIFRCIYVFAFVLLFVGCGGSNDGAKSTAPEPIEGPFATISGASEATFSLSPEDNDMKCVPKPGLKEWEYESKDPASGSMLRLVLKDHEDSDRDLEMEYGIDNPQHEVVVELKGGYKYKFFRHLRTDTNEIYNSYCTLEMTGEDDSYAGNISCTMLWADATSPDYKGATRMNAFVDLVARFECERRLP